MKKTALIIGLASLIFVAGCGYQTAPTTTMPTNTMPTATTPAPTTTTTPTTATTASNAVSSAQVTIANFQFSPASTEISIGGTVHWTNNDSIAHVIAADDGSFQSATLQPGESFSFTFAQAGDFPYHCQIHPSMKGTITVK